MSFSTVIDILKTATNNMSNTAFFESGRSEDLNHYLDQQEGLDLSLPLIWLFLEGTHNPVPISFSDRFITTYNLSMIILFECDQDNTIEETNRIYQLSSRFAHEYIHHVKKVPIELGYVNISGVEVSPAYRNTAEVLFGRGLSFSITIPDNLKLCDVEFDWCDQNSIN